MGSGPSSYKYSNVLSFLVDKKITTLKPTYLYYIPGYYDKFCLTFDDPNEKGNFFNKDDQIVIKINSSISFFIDDIIGYCYNEGGVYTYDYHLTFLQNINSSDVTFIKVPNADKANIEINNKFSKIYKSNKLFNSIYDKKNKIFKWFNLSKFVYTRDYFFTFSSKNKYDVIFTLEHYIKDPDKKYKYFLEKCVTDNYLITELEENELDKLFDTQTIDYKQIDYDHLTNYKQPTNYKQLTNSHTHDYEPIPYNKFNRILDYKDYAFFDKNKYIGPSNKKKKPLTAFLIILMVLFFLNLKYFMCKFKII